MKHEFKKINQGDVTRYVLESDSGGATVAGAVDTVPMPMGSVRRRSPEESKETPKPRNFVAKNAKMGGAGAHKDKKKDQKQGIEKHKKPYAEAANAAQQAAIAINMKKHHKKPKSMSEGDGGEEYNDEVGMADSNIHTIIRSAKELINVLEPMENMPEWAQDKLAQVKGMLVSVKDYIESQHEEGNIYHTDEDWGKSGYDTYAGGNHGRGVMEDAYIAELVAKLAEKIPSNAPVDVWIKDFEKSNAPQFKGKTKEKRRQMAIAASYGAKNPSKKK